MIPKLFSREPALFEPTRLAIVCEVARESDDQITFVQLKRDLELTDGNLNRHLHRLTKDGILTCTREKQSGRRPRTVIRITSDGRRRLAAFAEALAEAATHGRAVVGTGETSEPALQAPNSLLQSEARETAARTGSGVQAAVETTARSLVDDRFAGLD